MVDANHDFFISLDFTYGCVHIIGLWESQIPNRWLHFTKTSEVNAKAERFFFVPFQASQASFEFFLVCLNSCDVWKWSHKKQSVCLSVVVLAFLNVKESLSSAKSGFNKRVNMSSVYCPVNLPRVNWLCQSMLMMLLKWAWLGGAVVFLLTHKQMLGLGIRVSHPVLNETQRTAR